MKPPGGPDRYEVAREPPLPELLFDENLNLVGLVVGLPLLCPPPKWNGLEEVGELL